MSTSKPKTPYFSNGQALQSPPLTVRASRFAESVYNFLGLYVVSFFSRHRVPGGVVGARARVPGGLEEAAEAVVAALGRAQDPGDVLGAWMMFGDRSVGAVGEEDGW
ncbi:uncharacterized protein PFLUO_LOCUS694 [Penicillium psychrofluorescens]|uniref:uncharacterized protein n=1 Tax=Penicillium psychrofluorescens TaxID=3158075 RepID=UPI003CCD368C